ncbi:uncharacterized protein EDB93DRAFT_1164033 [Suillus bovinus]|uniref:uncharacterized protein n=1 Tax=Suillus bovinus TaxID=48563 RepID=UPI001B864654|nr:uncharacterized protein EDB93DRAFT_1164033 [Suillus bovinus]KAG2139080.1 hypothetical protein EDB93DRAFT_1164033 [Suillus bovinus]
MHFFSTIVLAVIAALVSSSSAMPTTSDAAGLDVREADKCPYKCKRNFDCWWHSCQQGTNAGYCTVSDILAFTSVEYGR